MKPQLPYGKEIATALPFVDAVAHVKEALKAEGFGILCEIDVSKTLKEKLGADVPPYVILGACNPQLAYRALQAEPYLGLLLPCNVVVAQQGESVGVAAIDATAMLGVVKNPNVMATAEDVNRLLDRVLDRLRD